VHVNISDDEGSSSGPPATLELLDRFSHLLCFTETAEHVQLWEKLNAVIKRMTRSNNELLTEFPPGDMFKSLSAEGDNPFADFRLEDLRRELTCATKTAKHWRGIWQTGETASTTHSSCYAALQAHLDATRDVIMRHNGTNFLVGVPGMRDSYLRLCSIYVDVYEALRLLGQLLASLEDVKRAKKRTREDIAEVRCACAIRLLLPSHLCFICTSDDIIWCRSLCILVCHHDHGQQKQQQQQQQQQQQHQQQDQLQQQQHTKKKNRQQQQQLVAAQQTTVANGGWHADDNSLTLRLHLADTWFAQRLGFQIPLHFQLHNQSGVSIKPYTQGEGDAKRIPSMMLTVRGSPHFMQHTWPTLQPGSSTVTCTGAATSTGQLRLTVHRASDSVAPNGEGILMLVPPAYDIKGDALDVYTLFARALIKSNNHNGVMDGRLAFGSGELVYTFQQRFKCASKETLRQASRAPLQFQAESLTQQQQQQQPVN
jgi:hypothetical protein